MRAEGQAHIDRIEAALALVRRSLDWDRAVRRLDELNARVEDPTLWDNPKKAEEVMRERRRLEAAIGTVNEITREMADAVKSKDGEKLSAAAQSFSAEGQKLVQAEENLRAAVEG